MFSSSDPIDHACLQLASVHCACTHSSKPMSSDVCLQSRSLTKALLFAQVDVSGDSCYKNLKEGVLGFPVVPNMCATR